MNLFRPRLFPDPVVAGVTMRPQDCATPSCAPELAAGLGVRADALVFAAQIHGTRVVDVSDGGAPGEADGMVCREPGRVLVLRLADCCGVLIFDPGSGGVAALHAGWRGASDGIVGIGIDMMERHLGSDPGRLWAYVSPCASGKRYEVGEEVARHFERSCTRGEEGKYLFDLAGEIRVQLRENGFQDTRIEIEGVCTIADQRCHSYRRDGVAAGRMAACIGVREAR